MRRVKYYLSILLLVLVTTSGTLGTAYADKPGNNGTIKIHEQGTPSGTESNDPKVCVFNVEGFSFDAAQTGYLEFDVQGGDGPQGVNAGPYNFGPTDQNGYYASQYFNLQPGHYKATLYGKELPNGKLQDEKAKSKVFKVICGTESPQPPCTCTVPTTPVTPGKGGGQVLGESTTVAATAPLTTVPGELTNTGTPTLLTSLLGLTLIVAASVVRLHKRSGTGSMPTQLVAPEYSTWL